jgi:uracil phosphoribosyltransferase
LSRLGSLPEPASGRTLKRGGFFVCHCPRFLVPYVISRAVRLGPDSVLLGEENMISCIREIPGVTGFIRVMEHAVANQVLTIMRDRNTPPEQFRANLSRLATIMAVDVTCHLVTDEVTIQTPLVETTGEKLRQNVTLAPILRAGAEMHGPFLGLLPDARVYHLGLKRDEATAEAQWYYCNPPHWNIAGDLVLVIDPMLATGGSASAAISKLESFGARDMAFLCAIAAPEGVAYLRENHPSLSIFAGAVDEGLNEKKYIVPGLGDAGDRACGTV